MKKKNTKAEKRQHRKWLLYMPAMSVLEWIHRGSSLMTCREMWIVPRHKGKKRLMFMTSVSGALRRGMTSLFLNNPIELKKNCAVLLCITCTCGRKLAYAVWEKYHRVYVRTSVTNVKGVKSASQANPLLRSKEEASQRMDEHIQRAWLSGATSTSCLTFQQKYCFFVFDSMSH